MTRLLFVTTLGILGTAGLDKRLSWPPNLPLLAQVLGTLVFVAGYFLMLWAMSVNAFFSQAVRIQTERGHTVVTDGPYAYVRHPGYVGMLAITLGGMLPAGVAPGPPRMASLRRTDHRPNPAGGSNSSGGTPRLPRLR